MIRFILMKIKNYKSMIPVMLVMTVMTLIFIYVFGVGFSKPYIPKAAIIDEDGTQASRMVAEKLVNQKGFDFTIVDQAEGLQALEKNNLVGVVHIPKGFEKNLELGKSEVTFFKSGASLEQITLENKLGVLVNEVLLDKRFSSSLSKVLQEKNVEVSMQVIYQDLVEKKEEFITYKNDITYFEKEDNVQKNSVKQYFAGFLLFFSMFIIMFGIGTLVEEKETHVWQRQRVSPLSMTILMTGNLISNFIVGISQLIFVVLVSKMVFGIDWGGSTLAMILILSAYVIAGTAMGLFIAGFVKNQRQLSAVLPTVITATSMIGGCMWPVDMMQNNFLRTLADFLPQRWGMEGLTQVLIYNGGIEDIIKPVVFLLVMGVVFLFAAIIPMKWES